jgi:hypothetical protein
MIINQEFNRFMRVFREVEHGAISLEIKISTLVVIAGTGVTERFTCGDLVLPRLSPLFRLFT